MRHSLARTGKPSERTGLARREHTEYDQDKRRGHKHKDAAGIIDRRRAGRLDRRLNGGGHHPLQDVRLQQGQGAQERRQENGVLQG